MILDTSFLLDLKDGQQAAFTTAMELYDAAVIQRIAMPTVMELHYGRRIRRQRRSIAGCAICC